MEALQPTYTLFWTCTNEFIKVNSPHNFVTSHWFNNKSFVDPASLPNQPGYFDLQRGADKSLFPSTAIMCIKIHVLLALNFHIMNCSSTGGTCNICIKCLTHALIYVYISGSPNTVYKRSLITAEPHTKSLLPALKCKWLLCARMASKLYHKSQETMKAQPVYKTGVQQASHHGINSCSPPWGSLLQWWSSNLESECNTTFKGQYVITWIK